MDQVLEQSYILFLLWLVYSSYNTFFAAVSNNFERDVMIISFFGGATDQIPSL